MVLLFFLFIKALWLCNHIRRRMKKFVAIMKQYNMRMQYNNLFLLVLERNILMIYETVQKKKKYKSKHSVVYLYSVYLKFHKRNDRIVLKKDNQHSKIFQQGIKKVKLGDLGSISFATLRSLRLQKQETT